MKKLILTLTMIAILTAMLCACGGTPEATPTVKDPMPSVNENEIIDDEDKIIDDENEITDDEDEIIDDENEDTDDENEDTDDSKDSELTDLEKGMLGKWLCMKRHEDCEDMAVELFSDKTAIYDGTTYTWELTQLDDGELHVDLNTISTDRYDPSHTAYVLNLSIMDDGNYEGSLSKKFGWHICNYYRADDYKDYDVVELTPENFADYVEIKLDSIFGDSSLNCHYAVQIKDEYGSASYCDAVIKCKVEEKTVTVYADNEYTVGETIAVGETILNYADYINFSGQYGWGMSGVFHGCDYDSDTDVTTGTIYFYEIIGAEDGVSGQIFVPKA